MYSFVASIRSALARDIDWKQDKTKPKVFKAETRNETVTHLLKPMQSSLIVTSPTKGEFSFLDIRLILSLNNCFIT